MTTLANHHSELTAAWQLAQGRWQATGEVWADQVHDQFAAQDWEPLAQHTAATVQSLERLAQVVAKAQRLVK